MWVDIPNLWLVQNAWGSVRPQFTKHAWFHLSSGVYAIQAAKKEAKDRKRRQATAIVGDMKPLEDTLPTLELLLRDTSSQRYSER